MRILLVFNVVFYRWIKIVTSIFINVKWLTLGLNWLVIFLHCVVPWGLESWVLLLKCLFYCNIPCATLFVFFYTMRWWELLPCVFNCNYNIGLFSFLPWGDGSCSLVCEVVFINIPYATTMWILVYFLFMPWGDGSCSLVCQTGINWYIMCNYRVLVRCKICICFLFYHEDWWKLLPCLLMLFIAVKMIVSAIVCKWVMNIVSAIVCMGASVWNICMCYCNCCLSYWICHRFNWNTCSFWCICCWSSYI